MSRSELLWLGLLVAIVLLPFLGFAPMIWRIVRHDEEPEPGGSLSRQMFGRRRRSAPRRSARVARARLPQPTP